MDKKQLIQQYQHIRKTTENLCHPLVTEDYVVQSTEDVSPPKWHLAHTTWFFETFVLLAHDKKYERFNPVFEHLFNSYYHTIGEPYPRVNRGLLSRPTVSTIYEYRHYVDQKLLALLTEDIHENVLATINMGLHHEQQHQELLLMDIKHNFSLHLDNAIYHSVKPTMQTKKITLDFIAMNGGTAEIGHKHDTFCFDNELPLHQQLLQPFLIANRLVTNAEYLAFIESGGYQKPEYWLADGWNYLQKHHWKHPLYWKKIGKNWHIFTLSGSKELDPLEPVSHVSFYEADAYARYQRLRLPTEIEWEHFVAKNNLAITHANLLETTHYQPCAASDTNLQFYGDLWEWTASSYTPYPGYKSVAGALGEYNGKFMSNQMVLRGGSCVTPSSHIRASYRNFFQPEKRWQFSGIRLASDN